MKYPIRCLPLVLAAVALHANAQSVSPTWDEYRKKEQAEQAPVQGQPATQAQTPVAAPVPTQPYAAPAASRAPEREQPGFFIGVHGGRGWIYYDIEQDAVAVNGGYRLQAGPWAQVGF